MMPLRLDFIADRGTTLPRAVYVCIAIEFFANLGSAINTVPITRLIEGAVCQRFYSSEVLLAEELCKSDGVQTDMAYLLGAMASFGSVPNLILTIPYGILSEHVDRRLILLANSVSAICKLLFNTAVCYSPYTNLKFLYLSSVVELIGGGGTVFMMILRTIIAENVPPSSLSTVLYKLSGINLLIRLGGVSFGSWLLRNGAASTTIIGVLVSSIVLPLLTFLPDTQLNIPQLSNTSIPLSYIKLDSEDPSELSDSSPTQAAKKSQEISTHQRFRDRMLLSLKLHMNLILHNRTFNMCLAIMFLNTVALDARNLLRPWLSKRYNWTLSQTGYVLSLESILSVSILFALQYTNTSTRWQPKTDIAKQKRELWISRMSILCGIVGSIILSFANIRGLFFIAAIIISGSAGFLDASKAYFTNQLDKEDIGRLYSTIMVIDTLATILSSPIWSSIYAVAYEWGGIWVGLPFLGSAAVFCLVLGLVMMLEAKVH